MAFRLAFRGFISLNPQSRGRQASHLAKILGFRLPWRPSALPLERESRGRVPGAGHQARCLQTEASAVVCPPLRWRRLQSEAGYQAVCDLVEPDRVELSQMPNMSLGAIVPWLAVPSLDDFATALSSACSEQPCTLPHPSLRPPPPPPWRLAARRRCHGRNIVPISSRRPAAVGPSAWSADSARAGSGPGLSKRGWTQRPLIAWELTAGPLTCRIRIRIATETPPLVSP